jgi:hypothetical protein
MSFRNFLNNNTQSAESASSLPSVSLTPQEAMVLLQAIQQASFKGEYAKQVVTLMEKLEVIASKAS